MNEQMNFEPVVFECEEYKDETGEYEHIQAVISPIRVLHKNEGEGREELIIFHGCSMYQTCTCERCLYSSYSRDKARERRSHDTK